MTEKIIPDGYKLVAVKGLDELVYWLERCKDKGHLENCADLIEPFEAFEYRNISEEAVIAAHEAKAEPFGYFRAEPFGWTDCAADDEGAIALYERPAAPAVPQGIPAQEVIDSIEAWKSAWLKVPPFADRVNKATREAITISHNSLFLLLQSAQQAQRMPAGCTTPTGCGPHGCHGACIAATPAAPSQGPVTLTDEDILRCAALTIGEQHVENCGLGDIKEFARAIIAALREKEQA